MEGEWIGAYYPRETIENSRIRAIMCLLFDKVVCFFPVADMVCGGGHGWSEDYSDNVLVEAGVIELREEFLLPELRVDSSTGMDWGTTQEEFNQYFEMQVTAMALNDAANCKSIPVIDTRTGVPAFLVEKLDVKRFARLQATALAIQSLDIAIPPLADISDDDILEARHKLAEQLTPFRQSMLSLAPTVRDGVQSGASVTDVYKEAQYVTETRIAPALWQLRERLSKERGRFWRRLVVEGGLIVPKFALNWITKDALSAAIANLHVAEDTTLDVFRKEEALSALRNYGGLGYLLNVGNLPKFKTNPRRKKGQGDVPGSPCSF